MNAVLDRPRTTSAPPVGVRGRPLPEGWPDDWPPPWEMGERQSVALLEPGACFPRTVFHALYEQTPPKFKAELIEGVVHVASPLSRRHGGPHLKFGMILSVYEDATPGLEACDNTSVYLSDRSEVQPDLFLRVRRDHGGRSRTVSTTKSGDVTSDDDGGYLTTGPEFVLEIARSSFTVDYHGKRRDYLAGGVREYVVANVVARTLHWFDFTAGTDVPVPVPEDGVLKSKAMPGLWLNGPALFHRRGNEARATLEEGLAAPEHAAFVERLAAAKAAGSPAE